MNNTKQETIFCPVDLPINFTIGLGDAHNLLGCWEETKKNFETVMGMDSLAPEGRTMALDAIDHLEGKIASLKVAIESAKQAYAKKVIAKRKS